MSRGLGTAQRRILAELDKDRFGRGTAPELAQALGMNDRQVRTALRSLERRGLVVITVESPPAGFSRTTDTRAHKGVGKYGPLRQKFGYKWESEIPTVIVREGEPWPQKPGYVAARDAEFYHEGMPVGRVMLVQLAESKRLMDSITVPRGEGWADAADKLFDPSKPTDGRPPMTAEQHAEMREAHARLTALMKR
ncbi:winged helix-turn-helix domain-containing protein [Rhodococcus fascians]|uniref:winged helix-turn-helix domain-containing protein n=1 Tax=Rhodococcoides fascians TaxID=1828 RepID=UPI001C6035D3|nr:winged helix-turn-helix domain-containing protein [Rhodococcus fascians]MBW4780490.1 winged helix-turn-helix domain-containing protein [Rhodococcus fascians]